MAKYLRDLYQSPSDMAWCRPTHRSGGRMMVNSCFSCCVLVPANCCWVFEMWGQGGGGAGSCCCQWGIAGGQGGDYGWRSYPCGCGTAQTICMCACNCCCRSPTCLGHPGQFSRLWNCTTGSCHVVNGGTGGINNCFFGVGTGCSYNQDYNIFRLTCTPGMPNFNNCGQGYYNTDWGINCDHCNGCRFFYSPGNCTTAFLCSNMIDSVFCAVNCACFCFYRRGQCGYGGYQGSYCCTLFACQLGVGGGAYAGGGPQSNICLSSTDQWAYCGQDGNFPGGGGHGAGSCGGGCCLGSLGGRGAILLSWGV